VVVAATGGGAQKINRLPILIDLMQRVNASASVTGFIKISYKTQEFCEFMRDG
jgi:hypothetical protein